MLQYGEKWYYSTITCRRFFTAVTMIIFRSNFLYFSYLCSKHRLLVHLNEAVLTRTHNLCFRLKIKSVYLCKPQFYYIKMGSKGCQLHGDFSMMERLRSSRTGTKPTTCHMHTLKIRISQGNCPVLLTNLHCAHLIADM